MQCPSCKRELLLDAVFCNYCGTRVQSSPPTTSQLPPTFSAPSPYMPNNTTQLSSPLPSPSSPGISPSMGNMPPVNTGNMPVFTGNMPPVSTGNMPPVSTDMMQPTMQPFRYGEAQITNGLMQPTMQPFRYDVTQPQQPPQTPVAQMLEPNALQKLLERIFQPALARSAALGIILGGILPVILGVICSLVFLAILEGRSASPGVASSSTLNWDYLETLLDMTPIHVLFRDALQLFLVANGVGIHVQYGAGAASTGATFSVYHANGLHALLFVPALLLVFGGYLAACSDFTNNPKISMLRGIAIAIPYTVVLWLLTTQVNGLRVSVNGTASPLSTSMMVSMDIPSLLMYGLLWGALFGAIGASLKLARGQWRRMLQFYLHTKLSPLWAGTLAGGVVATIFGILLSWLAVLSLTPNVIVSEPIVSRVLCAGSDWQILTMWSLSDSLRHAVTLLAFLTGSPITVVNQLQSTCFYSQEMQTTWSLFSSNLHLPSWIFLLALIPAFSLFLGGRVSAATARSQGVGPAAIQGALIALPFTLLMGIFCVMGTIQVTAANLPSSFSQSGLSTLTISFGVNLTDMLLWTLLSGALFGALGGIYQTSAVRQQVQHSLAGVSSALVTLCAPVFALFDRLSGYTQRGQRSSARNLLYGAFLMALLLLIVVAIAGGLLVELNQSISYVTNQQVQSDLSTVLIALPGVLLLCSAVVALISVPDTYPPATSITPPNSMQMYGH